MKATFDPEKLAFFLNQVWAHLDCHAPAYPSDVVMVNAMATNLEGKAMEGVMKLHDEDMPELGNIKAFMGELSQI